MDKHCEMLGWKKEYLICQATNLLGIAIGEVGFGNTQSEDENIESIMEMLEAYPYGTHYFAKSNTEGAYKDFINESFPNTVELIKRAVKSGKVNREKWTPVLNLFFKRAKEYISENTNEQED